MSKGRLSTVKPRIQMAEGRAVQTVNPDSWRSGKNSTQRGYGYRWQQARARFLAKHPLCCMCEEEGKVTAATVVDHINPHKGNDALMWDETNWQPLCDHHHSSTKQRMEKSGFSVGCDAEGIPLGVFHHWNA